MTINLQVGRLAGKGGCGMYTKLAFEQAPGLLRENRNATESRAASQTQQPSRDEQ
jgi:hypothetical protein